MNFEKEYKIYLEIHLQARQGERRRRLEEGHRHGEMLFLKNVWWPLFHHFQYLHPEYEVNDFKDGSRFLDFAYIHSNFQICFEVDGFGPHAKKLSRWQFADQLIRQNYLVIDGWYVIRFSVDQVTEQPRQCQQIIQLMIGRLLGQELNQLSISPYEKEVIRLAIRKRQPITNKEVQDCLNLTDKPVKKLLTQLVQKGLLSPTSGTLRTHFYQLTDKIRSPF